MVFHYLVETYSPFKIIAGVQSRINDVYNHFEICPVEKENLFSNGTMETIVEFGNCEEYVNIFCAERFYLIGFRTLVVLAVALVASIISAITNARSLPGPWIWPSLRAFHKDEPWYLTYHRITRKFGDIFGVRLGLKRVIVVAKYAVVRDLFTKYEFVGKPDDAFFKIIGGFGVINTSGTFWSNQRKFLHDNFMAFGLIRGAGNVNRIFEQNILSEAASLMHDLAGKCTGGLVDIKAITSVAVTNTISSVLMSTRFSIHDNIYADLTTKMNEGFRLFGQVSILQYFPFLDTWSWFNKSFKDIESNKNETHSFFQTVLDDHYVTFDRRKQSRDVLDCYLRQFADTKGKRVRNEIFEDKDPNLQIRQVMIDILTAGMESTNTTLQWALIYMMNHPEIARQVRAELDKVVGRDRLPAYSDKKDLPFTLATIYETLRKSSIVPLGNPHTVTEEYNWNGYLFRKNSEVVPLIYGMNNDEKLWFKPEEFRPSRFIREEEKTLVILPSYFMPFGVGKRICMGESLAMTDLFIFFACIMHCFYVEPEGTEPPSMKANYGVTLYPNEYKVRLTKRELGANFKYPDLPTIPVYESSKTRAKPEVW